MEKILITGTGRCGTTFLIKIFTFLKYNTGFTADNYQAAIDANCNAGMDKCYNEPYYIVKQPEFMLYFPRILNDKMVNIKKVIIPLRDYEQSAASRLKYMNEKGGLWNAVDKSTQIAFYEKIIANYVLLMTKKDIDTIFIDFAKMISNKKYLFSKLKSILQEKTISFEQFSWAYDKAAKDERCKKPPSKKSAAALSFPSSDNICSRQHSLFTNNARRHANNTRHHTNNVQHRTQVQFAPPPHFTEGHGRGRQHSSRGSHHPRCQPIRNHPPPAAPPAAPHSLSAALSLLEKRKKNRFARATRGVARGWRPGPTASPLGADAAQRRHVARQRRLVLELQHRLPNLPNHQKSAALEALARGEISRPISHSSHCRRKQSTTAACHTTTAACYTTTAAYRTPPLQK